jgi:hypothetical protein
MQIKRDWQTEYEVLLASFDGDDESRGGWRSITERIAQLCALAQPAIQRDWQGEYDMLLTASGDGNALELVAEIDALIGEAEAAGEKIAAGQQQ